MDIKDIKQLKDELKNPVTKLFCPQCNTELCSADERIITDFPDSIDYFKYERGEPQFLGTYKYKYIPCKSCGTKVQTYTWENSEHMCKLMDIK